MSTQGSPAQEQGVVEAEETTDMCAQGVTTRISSGREDALDDSIKEEMDRLGGILVNFLQVVGADAPLEGAVALNALRGGALAGEAPVGTPVAGMWDVAVAAGWHAARGASSRQTTPGGATWSLGQATCTTGASPTHATGRPSTTPSGGGTGGPPGGER